MDAKERLLALERPFGRQVSVISALERIIDKEEVYIHGEKGDHAGHLTCRAKVSQHAERRGAYLQGQVVCIYAGCRGGLHAGVIGGLHAG